MLQCDVYAPCVAPEPPTVVETTKIIQPPPRVVIIQPRVFVRPRHTVVIRRPPIYQCGSSWSGCPAVRGGWVRRGVRPFTAPYGGASYGGASYGGAPDGGVAYQPHGEAFMSQGGDVDDGGGYNQN